MKDIKRILFAVAITIISICGIIFTVLEKLEVEEQGVINYNNTNEEIFNDPVEEIEQVEEIFVQICGAINEPGVYKVTKGTRLFELVTLAGGLQENANEMVINQARELKDEESIYFPTNQEVTDGSYIIDGKDALIDINRGTIEQLITLTGIGEAKAKSIISYREKNGDYETIEDIMNVPGIKESLFEMIKDLITV